MQMQILKKKKNSEDNLKGVFIGWKKGEVPKEEGIGKA